jgi:pyruvate kinase
MDIDAKVIVVLSESGTTARYVAKFRPAAHVVCLTTDPSIARQSAGVLLGCKAFLVPSLENNEALASQVATQAILAGMAIEGDLMIVVYGKSYGKGANDHIRVERMQKGDAIMVEPDAPLGSLSYGF